MKERATLILRIPFRLHRALKSDSKKFGISINALCTSKLDRFPASNNAGDRTDSLSEDPRLNFPYLHPVVNEISEVFADELEGVILFGSRARGDATENSDTDLAIIIKSTVAFDRSIYKKWDSKMSQPDLIAPLFLHLPDSLDEVRGIWFELAIDGIVLCDQSLAISRFLTTVRNLIATGQAVRKHTYGVPYWVSDFSPGYKR